ncbi:hypothetical protein ISCGN_001786 [Ixodes scapularis]
MWRLTESSWSGQARTPVYRKQGPKWCVASPGGPRRVQTYPGLSSTTRMPFSLDTGSPRTARRGWVLATFYSGSVVSPKWLGSVVMLLTKHLAPKVQAPPAELGVRGDATLQTPAFTGTSSYGLGTVLLQEQHLPKQEGSALGLLWANQRFKKLLHNLSSFVETDHQPLIQLLGSDLMPRRVQRFRIRLLRYQFTVQYVPVKCLATANMLFRDPEVLAPAASTVDSVNLFVSQVVTTHPKIKRKEKDSSSVFFSISLTHPRAASIGIQAVDIPQKEEEL